MNCIDVAVGVVKNRDGRILIALRDAALHQGGLWEFPGGKVEAGESVETALARELGEELGISIHSFTPLINIKHQYPDLSVRLHVFTVDSFSGEAQGCQGQPIEWVTPEELGRYAFPEANRPIIAAARLPACYAILDDNQPGLLLANLRHLLAQGHKLIQARLKRIPKESLTNFLEQAYPLCRRHQTILLLNSAAAEIPPGLLDGVHLTSQDLMSSQYRPEGAAWLAASCHNLAELKQAEQIGADFAVLAPVLPTQTHPGAATLGWQGFAELVDQVNIPVYALGGMAKPDLARVKQLGGQGIAGISAFSQ